MQKTIRETTRRRKLQKAYNEKNKIVPATIYKSVEEIMNSTSIADVRKRNEKEDYGFSKVAEPILKYMDDDQKQDLIEQLREQMHAAAKDLEFEKAASLRDEIQKLEKMVKS
jgi:excinuclease ABC subunit B